MMMHKLLIVDDETANLRLLERLFQNDYQCLTASSGAEAIRLLEQHDVAILITDQRMPEITGLELLKRTAELRPQMVRILLTGYTDVEALVEAINSGLVYMYVSKPWNIEDLRLRVGRACEHYQNNKSRQVLAGANQRLLLKLSEIKLGVVTALTEMLKTRDKHEYAHALRVRDYSTMIAAKLGVGEEQEEELSLAAMLHDLGRIDYSRNGVGVQPSGLEHVIEAHARCEAKLLFAIPELANVAEIVSGYRENYDGTGLPRGLRAEQIPMPCRILRLADEYDQMILPKALPSMTHDEAMRFLIQRSGKQFDPQVIEVLSKFSTEDLDQHNRLPVTYGVHRRLRQDTFDGNLVGAPL
jgi:response regulator RpfG family c-di-GMP phosphodiesterase